MMSRRLRELKKDLAYAKSRPSWAFSKPFTKESYIAGLKAQIKKLERRK